MFWKRLCMTLMPLSLVLAGCTSAPTLSEGACAQPLTKASPAQVTPGQTVRVSAADMWVGCNDQGSHPQLPPLKNQPVTMTVDGQRAEVGRVSADPNTGVAQTMVTIPAMAAPGKIGLTIGIAPRADVTVIVKLDPSGR